MTTPIKVKDGRGEDAARYESEYEFGADLKSSAKLFGDEVVHSGFVGSAKIQLQDILRPMLKEGKPRKELDAVVTGFMPGVRTRKAKSTVDKAKDAWGKLTEEQRAELLADLKKEG